MNVEKIAELVADCQQMSPSGFLPTHPAAARRIAARRDEWLEALGGIAIAQRITTATSRTVWVFPVEEEG